MSRILLAVAMFASMLFAAASSGQSQDFLKSPSEMTLDQLRDATLRNLGVLNAVQREILRRNPKARPFEGYDPGKASVDPQVERQIGGASNDQLVDLMAAGAARIEALASEGSRRLAKPSAPALAKPSAPILAPPAQPRQSPAPALAERKSYCKAMYGKAYMLCDRDDRSCKFLAASHWEECEKTGRWRD